MTFYDPFFLKKFPDHWLSKSLSPDLLSLKKRLDTSLLNVEPGRDFRRRLKLPSPPVGEEGKGEGEAKVRPGGLITL